MGNERFYEERTAQSYIKAQIVSKYFTVWARIMANRVSSVDYRHIRRIAYLDLFAGRGYYKDGSASTPILILEQAIKEEKIANVLVSTFNDADPENAQVLRESIYALLGIERLVYPPVIHNTSVDEEAAKVLESVNLVPTLFFVDPWGYKALSLRLIRSVLKNWGCDCIFFFNYNRINMGLSNPLFFEHMASLFGEQRAKDLYKRLSGLSVYMREQTVTEEFTKALKEIGGTYVLTFGFKNDEGTRTSHLLVFASKHQRGYDIMQEIMARLSSSSPQGIGSFEYDPTKVHPQAEQLFLFQELEPLRELEQLLLDRFAGRKITVEQAFQDHHIGTRYIEKNYREAFKNLETRGAIMANVLPEQRRKRNGEVTMKGVLFTFPVRK